MPSPTAAELEWTWSRLYVAIINVQHQVALQRSTADATPAPSFNVPLESHPGIAEGLSAFYLYFVEDYKDSRTDSATFEFFIKFGVLEETVQLAARDIPQGILGHVVSLFGAMVAHLPPDAFLHEKVSGAIKKLCKLLPMVVDSSDSCPLVAFLEAIIAKLIQERGLSLVFADVKRPLLSTLRALLRTGEERQRDFFASDLSHLLQDALLVLSGDYDSELETLFLELVFRLVDLFCNGQPAAFCAMFSYLGRCLEALKGYRGGEDEQGESTESALAFIDLYRDNFVDRIFARVLLCAARSRDGSLAELLGKVLGLLEGGDRNDLVVILVGKMMRTLEKSRPELLSADKWTLIYLYSHILGSRRLQSGFATHNPTPWKESSMAHRHRLECTFFLVQRATRSVLGQGKDQPALLSGLYKCHLGVLESMLPPGYTLGDRSDLVDRAPGQAIPRLGEAFSVLDRDKNQLLWSLYEFAKTELVNFWSIPSLAKQLVLCQFITRTLALSDTVTLYTEYVSGQDGGASLLQALSRLVKGIPEATKDAPIDSLLIKHQHVDALDQDTWGTLPADPDSGSPVLLGTYLLTHILMRMAAIVQARAIRPPVKIYYE